VRQLRPCPARSTFDGLREGNHALVIEQGVEMGRPSLIHLHLDCSGAESSHARIGGEAVKISEGRLVLDGRREFQSAPIMR
jgi:trans-2,3-dihydro-3-hydroxyanthranilate isomerase